MSIAASKQQCLVMYPLRTPICGLVHIISTVSVTLCGKRWGDVSTEKIWRVCLTATWPWRSFYCGSHADLILIAIETIPTLEHMWLVIGPSQVGRKSDYWNSDEKWGMIETLQDVYGSYSDLYWIYMDLQFKVEVKSLRLLMPGIAMEQRAWSIAWSQPWTGNKPTASRGASFTFGLLDAQGIGFPSFLLMFYELKICQHPMYPMFSLHQGWTCWFGSAAIIWFDEYYIYIIYLIHICTS